MTNQLTWPSDWPGPRPITVGHYFYRKERSDPPEKWHVVEVYTDREQPMVVGRRIGGPLESFECGQFAGPILEPTEPEASNGPN